jgi:hypothetical protein
LISRDNSLTKTQYRVPAKQSFWYELIKMETTVVNNCLLVVVSILIPLFGQNPGIPRLHLSTARHIDQPQMSAVIKLYNSRLLGTPNTTTITKTTERTRKTICT